MPAALYELSLNESHNILRRFCIKLCLCFQPCVRLFWFFYVQSYIIYVYVLILQSQQNV